MSGKSRRSRGKHSFRSKKSRGRPTSPVIATQQQMATPTGESVSPSEVSAPSASTSVPATKTAVRHPYIFAELRRIGILAGIMLAILIVLALVW